MAKDLTDLFGSLPDFVLQGLGPNEIFNIIQQGDPFPLSPGGTGGPGIEERSFFDDVSMATQGDPVATQQEMVQEAVRQLDAEKEGIVPDVVRQAANTFRVLEQDYDPGRIRDILGDLYPEDINWSEVEALNTEREIAGIGINAFIPTIEAITGEIKDPINLNIEEFITQAPPVEADAMRDVRSLSEINPSMFSGNLGAGGYPDLMGRRVSPARIQNEYGGVPTQPPGDLPPENEALENAMIELVNKEQEAFRRMGEYTQAFTPGLGAYGEVPTDFPSSPQQYISTADPDADRILRSLRPELGQEDIIAETPYQEDTKEHWERILRDQEEQRVEEKLASTDDATYIKKVMSNYLPEDVKDVPTTTWWVRSQVRLQSNPLATFLKSRLRFLWKTKTSNV